MSKLIYVSDLLYEICLDDTEENREENVGEIVTLEDIDRVPSAGEKLVCRLMERINDRAIKVSTAKLPHTYLTAVGTKELAKILREELL
jgi:hypothetical protein